jgi:hypothetical protein
MESKETALLLVLLALSVSGIYLGMVGESVVNDLECGFSKDLADFLAKSTSGSM